MRELRALTDRLRSAFEVAGFGEVWTPALEYEEVLRTGDERAAGAPYRLFDEHGEVLALRSDMTIPIARVVATPYREARGAGVQREFLQGGIELIGVPGPAGEAEVVALVIAALADAGLDRHRVGIGDGSLYRTLLRQHDVAEEDQHAMLEALSRRDLVELARMVDRLGLPELLMRLPELRGGPEVLERADHKVGTLRELHGLLEARGVADRVIYDLGLVRELGYYTGAVFEVYDPAVGFALGGGGRYDELIGRFGQRALPACGIALDVQRVHIAQMAEERLR